MSNLKVILLLFLVCKSTIGFSISIDLGFSGSCCADKTTQEVQSCPESGDEDKKKCCDTSVCDCLCCGHVFNLQSSKLPAVKETVAPELKIPSLYSFLYLHSFSAGIWQPPRRH